MIGHRTLAITRPLRESEQHLLLLMRLETLGLATVAELKAYEPTVDVGTILRELEVSDLVYCQDQPDPTIAEISSVPPCEDVAPLLSCRDTSRFRCTRAAGRLLDGLGLQHLTLDAFARNVGGKLAAASGFLDVVARYRSRNYMDFLGSAWSLRTLQAAHTPISGADRICHLEQCASDLLLMRLSAWVRSDRESWLVLETLDKTLKDRLQWSDDRIELGDKACEECQRNFAVIASSWPSSRESGAQAESAITSVMPMNYQLTSALLVPPADRDEEFVGCFDWTDEVVCAVIAGEFRRAYDLCRSSIRTGTTKADLHRLLSTLRAFRDDAEGVSPKFRDTLKEFRAWLKALQPAYAADQSNSAASPLIIMACRRLYRRLAFLARAQLELSIDLANNGCDEALERASRAIDDLDAVEALLRWKGVETNGDFSRWLRSQLRASVRMRNGGE